MGSGINNKINEFICNPKNVKKRRNTRLEKCYDHVNIATAFYKNRFWLGQKTNACSGFGCSFLKIFNSCFRSGSDSAQICLTPGPTPAPVIDQLWCTGELIGAELRLCKH